MRDTAKRFGVEFDAWQDGAGRLILSKRADGTYACSVGGVLMSIPRQVGKTFLIGAIVFALCLLNPGLTVLWTAHRLRTAEETFGKMQGFARKAKVKPHISKIVLGAGDEAIEFHNGSRILFGARERGFGRGFDDIGLEVFDEAQILGENAIDDMIPAMNTAANPLAIFIGTPPKPTDPSEFFTNKRAALLSGEDEDGCLIEIGADPDADPNDRKQWAKGNPSYPKRTPETAVLRLQKMLGPESFLREGLGIWPDDDVRLWQTFDRATWDAGEVGPSGMDPATVALEVSIDYRHAALSAAGPGREGEQIAVLFTTDPSNRDLTGQLIDQTDTVQQVTDRPILVDKGSPADKLRPTLEAAGWEFTVVERADVATAASDLLLGVIEGRVGHQAADDQAALTLAAAHVVQRRHGDAFYWDRRAGHLSLPLIAASLALWGSRQETETVACAAVYT